MATRAIGERAAPPKSRMDHGLLQNWDDWEEAGGDRVDTLVDPVELVSSSHMPAAPRVDMPRTSLPSIDPDAQVQWFSRGVLDEEPASTVDLEILWDEESDTEPTLVLRRRAQS